MSDFYEKLCPSAGGLGAAAGAVVSAQWTESSLIIGLAAGLTFVPGYSAVHLAEKHNQ